MGKPDLIGVVNDTSGTPLAHASVFIYTAGPKDGPGILCPSCYADCRKRARTDREGRFKIESLDPSLLFRVLFVAPNHRPKFVTKVDPAVKPLQVALEPREEAVSSDQQMKGRVVDPDGKPISGAVVSIRGVSFGDTTSFGGNEAVDQVAVTDDNGLFLITSQMKFDAVGVEVEARAFAKGVFAHLPTGGKVHELKLTEGASVKGRVIKDGQPVPGVEIGICSTDRNAETYVGDYSIGTDKDGRFLFSNLPPNRSYELYGIMSSLGEKGSIAARALRVDEDGSVADAGDIPIGPAVKLEGQLRLSDGKPVPPKTRVLVGREEAWDSAQLEADKQGRFKLLGVPQETISVSARVPGYHLSSRNKSLEPTNPFRLLGALKADKTDLVLEFEPGESQRPVPGDYVDLREDPLRGAEPAKPGARDIHVLASVIDAENGKPVEAFTLTEGRSERFPEPTVRWIESRKTEGTHGRLELFLSKGATAPAVMVEADGYLPQASAAIEGTETNITFALKRGTNLAGLVLKPDAQVASGVTVYLTDNRNGVYIQDERMTVREGIYRGTRSTQTDEKGAFSFKPKIDDSTIVVLSDDGFAEVPVQELITNAEVRLQPWARIEGKLLIGARPGANEEVQLWPVQLPYQYYPRMFPPLQLYLKTTTDSDGQFRFERVPPINIQVYHSPKVRDSKMGMNPMSQTTSFALKPGENKNLALGGKGRPVIGRCRVEGYEGTINWRSQVQQIELILPPAEELPDLIAFSREQSAKIQAADSDAEKQRLADEMRKAQEELTARQRAFYATEKGRDYFFQNKRYALNFAPDGTFRIEDVPGGKYRLRIDLREGDDLFNFSAPAIASLNKEFEVPESPGGQSDEPFDLGTLEMQSRQALAIGKPAPNFEVKTADEKTVRLSDFAGKYVLLDFWAVWCGPCVAETPHLQAAYEAYKDDPRFRMIGLSLDPNIKTPRDYARKHELRWIMGFLGDWSKADLPAKYGVEGIPSIFLIGPDGKLLAKDLRGESIKTAVGKALGRTESAKASSRASD